LLIANAALGLAARRLTMTDRKEWTASIPVAGARYYGLGRGASYAAAKRGEIPTIKIGSRIRANIPAIERQFEEVQK
jgi:hypothetical protein